MLIDYIYDLLTTAGDDVFNGLAQAVGSIAHLLSLSYREIRKELCNLG